jgi:hypothetical protein
MISRDKVMGNSVAVFFGVIAKAETGDAGLSVINRKIKCPRIRVMNRNIFSIGLLFCILASPTFAGTVTGSYSWEDGGTHLGQYGNVGSAENLYWDGSRGNVLALTEEPVKSTPQSYVA